MIFEGFIYWHQFQSKILQCPEHRVVPGCYLVLTRHQAAPWALVAGLASTVNLQWVRMEFLPTLTWANKGLPSLTSLFRPRLKIGDWGLIGLVSKLFGILPECSLGERKTTLWPLSRIDLNSIFTTFINDHSSKTVASSIWLWRLFPDHAEWVIHFLPSFDLRRTNLILCNKHESHQD